MFFRILRILLIIQLLCSFDTNGQSNSVHLHNNQGLVTDSLSNGFRYIIQPSSGNTVEFRLVVHVGSLQETINECGVAHFLEHMLFNHTENFPDRKIVDTLSFFGYRFGKHINAYTDYDRTVYQISLLDHKQQYLALSILSDIVSKAQFREIDMEKERKIIFQEIRDIGVREKFSAAKLMGSTYADRVPYGTEENVRHLELNQVAAFYRKWYAPQMATLIVTGNVDIAQVTSDIKNIYSSIPRSTYSNKLHNVDSFHPSYVTKLAQEEKHNLVSNKLEIIQFATTQILDRVDNFKRRIIEDIYTTYLTQKLAQTESKARYSNVFYLPHQTEHSFEITAKTERDLLKEVNLLGRIIGTLKRTQITLEELNALKIKYAQRMKPHFFYTDATVLADNYVNEVALGNQYMDPKIKFELTEQLLPSITTADLQEIHNYIWFKNVHKFLYVLHFDSVLFSFKDSRKLDSSWNNGLHQSLQYFEPKNKVSIDTASEQIYSWTQLPPVSECCSIEDLDSKTPNVSKKNSVAHKSHHSMVQHKQHSAQVIQEKYYPNIGAAVITFSNGIRVIVRPTSDKDDNLVLSFATRGGLDIIPDSLYSFFQSANYFIGESWLQGLSREQSLDFQLQKQLSSLVSISDQATILSTESSIGNIDDVMQWSYRKLYRYEKPKEEFKEYIQHQMISGQEEGKSSSNLSQYPSVRLMQKVSAYQSNLRDAINLPMKHEWQKVNLDHMFEVFDQKVTHPNTAFIIISGHITVEEVKQKALQYFGSIPSLKPLSKWNNYLPVNSQQISSTGKRDEEHKETLGTEKERLYIAMVFNGYIQPTPKEYMVTQLIKNYFHDIFLSLSREKEGLVYSPYTEMQIELYPKAKTCITLNFTAQHSDIPRLEKLALQAIETIQSQQFDAHLLQRMKRTLFNSKNKILTDASPNVWVDELRDALLNYDSLNSLENYETILNSVTVEDISRTAETIFSKKEHAIFYVTP